MNKPPLKNRHLLDSVRNALAGIGTAVRHEKVFVIELLFTAAVTIAGYVFRISRTEAAVIAICCTLVLSAECLNSALERVVDLVSPDFHPLAKQIKDLAAGAVLITAIGSMILGIQIFWPKLIALL